MKKSSDLVILKLEPVQERGVQVPELPGILYFFFFFLWFKFPIQFLFRLLVLMKLISSCLILGMNLES